MAALTLLHPWLLLGLAGAALPLLIHLIGRRRASTIHFAAFDFLMAVNKRLARWERLRQILLLLLRTLAIAALAFAVARPVHNKPAAATAQSRRVAVVIDASSSMSYELAGKTLFARAKERAKELLSHLSPGDAATVIVAGREVRSLFQTPSLDLPAVRTAIEQLELESGSADLGAAIELAMSQLGAGSSGTLFVVSDLAENSFATLRPTALDPPPEVRLIDAAEREQPTALGNLAIENIQVERGEGAANERRFTVTIKNYGGGEVSGRTLELLINGAVTQRGFVDVGPRSVQEKTYTHAFETPGVYDAEVRLTPSNDDGYAADDRVWFGVIVVPGVRVLAVNGDPKPTPYEDELFFLERALEAVPKGEASMDVKLVDLDELPKIEDLSGFDVIVLANVGDLPADTAGAVQAFVEKGGGLLLALGDKVRFETANEKLKGLLPHPLRDLHLAADPAAGTPPLGIGDLDWDHPILRGLGQAAEESLRASRTTHYFNLDVGADRKARAVLRFDNGAPALVEGKRADKGRVMLLTTSLDVDFTDLPIRSAFPALLQRTVRYLAQAVDADGRAQTRIGEPIELLAPTGSTAVTLVSPSGRRLETDLPEGAASRARFGGLDETGFWRAEVGRNQGTSSEPRLDVAVSASLKESDFMPVRPAQVAAALGKEGAPSAIEVALGQSGEGDPFLLRGVASYLLLALCVVFLGESLLAARG